MRGQWIILRLTLPVLFVLAIFSGCLFARAITWTDLSGDANVWIEASHLGKRPAEVAFTLTIDGSSPVPPMTADRGAIRRIQMYGIYLEPGPHLLRVQATGEGIGTIASETVINAGDEKLYVYLIFDDEEATPFLTIKTSASSPGFA
ncbi:MAG: hypothetical protein IT368_07170 [Candidatus Hydrogenedentes bacterium]|nr:hypothetical protein [Candidatus Hydrogenedentota bacterium]